MEIRPIYQTPTREQSVELGFFAFVGLAASPRHAIFFVRFFRRWLL
jgi:hypothetical protein